MDKVKSEINQLVDAYNAIEIEQGQRLARLFRLVKQGKGYRCVKFSGDMWTNCWDLPDRMDKRTHIDRLERMITEVKPGE